MYRIDAEQLIPGSGDPVANGTVVIEDGTITYAGPTDGAPAVDSVTGPAGSGAAAAVHLVARPHDCSFASAAPLRRSAANASSTSFFGSLSIVASSFAVSLLWGLR